MNVVKIVLLTGATVFMSGLSGCATESSSSIPIQHVESAARPFTGVRTLIAAGKFDNRPN